ncbi:MAG TPA: hypothetical protein PKN75_06805 [Bacteroidia bacterium]|nr:hypothetical protein [Bacteroidia bacterium]
MLKKSTLLFCAFFWNNCYSQDVINPYIIREDDNNIPSNNFYSSVNIEILPSNFLWESTPDEDVSPSGTRLKHSYGVETSIAPVISVNN